MTSLMERLEAAKQCFTGIGTDGASIDLKPETVLVNPDGPEAAALIRELVEALGIARERLIDEDRGVGFIDYALRSKPMTAAWPPDALFQFGAFVQKKGRASWRGKVCGWYRTELTALGYAVESRFEPGSVQIYPETALLPWNVANEIP